MAGLLNRRFGKGQMTKALERQRIMDEKAVSRAESDVKRTRSGSEAIESGARTVGSIIGAFVGGLPTVGIGAPAGAAIGNAIFGGAADAATPGESKVGMDFAKTAGARNKIMSINRSLQHLDDAANTRHLSKPVTAAVTAYAGGELAASSGTSEAAELTAAGAEAGAKVVVAESGEKMLEVAVEEAATDALGNAVLDEAGNAVMTKGTQLVPLDSAMATDYVTITDATKGWKDMSFSEKATWKHDIDPSDLSIDSLKKSTLGQNIGKKLTGYKDAVTGGFQSAKDKSGLFEQDALFGTKLGEEGYDYKNFTFGTEASRSNLMVGGDTTLDAGQMFGKKSLQANLLSGNMDVTDYLGPERGKWALQQENIEKFGIPDEFLEGDLQGNKVINSEEALEEYFAEQNFLEKYPNANQRPIPNEIKLAEAGDYSSDPAWKQDTDTDWYSELLEGAPLTDDKGVDVTTGERDYFNRTIDRETYEEVNPYLQDDSVAGSEYVQRWDTSQTVDDFAVDAAGNPLVGDVDTNISHYTRNKDIVPGELGAGNQPLTYPTEGPGSFHTLRNVDGEVVNYESFMTMADDYNASPEEVLKMMGADGQGTAAYDEYTEKTGNAWDVVFGKDAPGVGVNSDGYPIRVDMTAKREYMEDLQTLKDEYGIDNPTYSDIKKWRSGDSPYEFDMLENSEDIFEANIDYGFDPATNSHIHEKNLPTEEDLFKLRSKPYQWRQRQHLPSGGYQSQVDELVKQYGSGGASWQGSLLSLDPNGKEIMMQLKQLELAGKIKLPK